MMGEIIPRPGDFLKVFARCLRRNWTVNPLINSTLRDETPAHFASTPLLLDTSGIGGATTEKQ